MVSWLQAVSIGLLQGVSELFPVSSLGHTVVVPALIGGSWARDLDVSKPESPYLAFVVGLHVATAIALIVYFRRDWVRIVGGLLTSIRDRRVETSAQKLAWLLVLATIPVGLVGLLLEHTLRTTFGRPVAASAFLMVNGLLLLAGERLRRRAAARETAAETPLRYAGAGPIGGHLAAEHPPGPESEAGRTTADAGHRRSGGDPRDDGPESDQRLAALGWWEGIGIGTAQILALAAGISRSGSAMVAGLLRGLSHEDAARFSFLLATPVILAAGVLKLPDLSGPLGNGIRGQVLVGSLLSGIGAYLAVRFLSRYFETRTLTPFAIYCLAFGGICLVRFAAF